MPPPPPHFRFFLINADTNQVEEEPVDNGATLDILSSSAGAAPQSSFVAVWDVYRRPLVQSLVFNLDGPVTRRNHTESYAPFTVFGEDSTGAYRGRVLLNGSYTLSVKGYAEKLGAGALRVQQQVTFSVQNL